MEIRIVCQEGFSPEYTGGGGYLNGVYRYLPYKDYIRLATPNKQGLLRNVLYPYHFIALQRRLLRELKARDPVDLIHNNNVLEMPRLKDVPVVTTLHHLQYHMYTGRQGILQNIKYFPAEGSMVRHSDHIITVSNFTKNLLLRYFPVQKENVVVIPNGINTEVFSPKQLPERKIILFPNALRFPQRKGTYFLMSVLKEVLRQHPDLECIVPGNSSPEGDAIRAQMPATFKHIGFISEQELSNLYAQSLFVLFPSLYEGFGLIPLEVISSGGIIVSADVGATKDFIHHDQNGFLLPHDLTRWRETITRLIDDPALRESIRKKARNTHVKSWSECASDHKRFFESII